MSQQLLVVTFKCHSLYFHHLKTLETSTMSLVLEIPKQYLGAFDGGFSYGSVFYTSACLPYLAKAKQT
jgi:hypothetical protein